MIGIKETKEVLNLGFDLYEGIVGSLADNKITLMDFPNFLPVLRSAPSALEGINQVIAELKDLDEAERKELLDFARERFDLPDDELEALIEETLEEVLRIYVLSIKWIDRKNQKQA